MNWVAYRTSTFTLFALFSIVIALHHLYEYFFPFLRPDYSPIRHLLFFLINLVVAAAMLKRNWYFFSLLLLLSFQQLYGHGANLVNGFNSGKGALYTDWVILILVPIVLLFYVYDLLRSKLNRRHE